MTSGGADPSIVATLFSAAYNGNLPVVKSLVKDKGISADVCDPTQVTERTVDEIE